MQYSRRAAGSFCDNRWKCGKPQSGYVKGNMTSKRASPHVKLKYESLSVRDNFFDAPVGSRLHFTQLRSRWKSLGVFIVRAADGDEYSDDSSRYRISSTCFSAASSVNLSQLIFARSIDMILST
mmetsp:Transcript_10703/g.15921  ORF Transcript_10703/g.15921 Transcript_10703/m.15921 type:complete len:124 (-) Transcript_10703:80-451(-)